MQASEVLCKREDVKEVSIAECQMPTAAVATLLDTLHWCKPGIYGGLQCFWPPAPTLCKLV